MYERMHHPVFEKFEVLTSSEISPEFHYGFLGEVIQKSFDDGVAAVLGLQPVIYPAGGIRSGDYPRLNEEYIEWIDVLETAIAATRSFTIIELGAGYGRWLVRAALAVKRCHGDLPIKLIGVEAEPTHFHWLKQHLRNNGIDPDEHELIEAAVDEKDGEVFFHVGKPDEWYGQAIAEHANAASESVRKVRAVSPSSILSSLDSVDLIDLDVQGAEFIVLRGAISALNEKVKRVHIGTHGHDIELELRTLFRQNGWYKLNDYSCQSTEATPWGDVVFNDGVQTWINPRLSPVQPTTGALNHLQEVLETSERREARLKLNLNSLQQENGQLRASLAQSQQDAAQLRTGLEQSQHKNRQVQAEAAHLQSVISAMESSGFWKLSQACLRLKRAVGFKSE
jgi:FkbM family methyltransferase